MKNMKRFVSLLLVVAMLASLPVMASAAANDHKHEYETRTVERGCTTQGYVEHKCKTCGIIYKTDVVPSLHDYPDTFAAQSHVDAKDGEYGYTPHKCPGCSETIRVMDVPDHAHGEETIWQTRTVLTGSCATKEHKSYITKTCEVCHKVETVTNAGTADHVWPTEGNYQADGKFYTVSVDSTISKLGLAYRTCEVCNLTEVVDVPLKSMTYIAAATKGITSVYSSTDAKTKIGELPAGADVLVVQKTDSGMCKILSANGDSWIKTSDLNLGTAGEGYTPICTHPGTSPVEFYKSNATCAEPQFKAYKCLICDEYWKFEQVAAAKNHTDKFGKVWEDLSGKENTFQIANDSAWVITKQPTETEDGQMQRVCAACGAVEKATGAASGAGFKYYNVKILKKLVPANETAVVTGGEIVEVYNKFETGRTVSYYAAKGTNLTILGYSTDKTWVNVKSELERVGWMKASAITVGKTGSVSGAYDGATHFGYVASGADAKVRSAKDQTSAVVSSLAAGSSVVIYGIDGNWARVESKTADKWIELTSLSTKAPLFYEYSVKAPTASLVFTVAEGHVTSSVNLNIRESAAVSSKALGGFAPNAKVYIYEIKSVNGVQWAKVLGMKSGSAINWKEITKADLEDTSKTMVTGWVCMTYVALDTEVGEPSGVANGTAAAKTGTVATGGIALNVRKSYDVYADKVGALPNGTKVTIYETAEAKNGVKWGRISQNSIDGWVCLQYVTMDASASGSTSASGTAAKANAAVANCATAVNVRSKSDISGAQIARIPVGTRIAITKTQNGWGYVDGKGWVYLQYVAFDTGALESLNAATGTGSANTENAITKYTAVTLPAQVAASLLTPTKVYAKADLTSDVVLTIYAKDAIKVIDRTIVANKLWYKISEGSSTGWIPEKVWLANEIIMQAVTGKITEIANVYEAPSVDSNVKTVLGVGSKFMINEGNSNHKTEGIYAWAQLSTGGWIQLHKTSLDAVINASFLPSYSETPAITGSVTESSGLTLYKEHSMLSTPLVNLPKDTSIKVLDWYYDAFGRTWGKVTQGQYTGWLLLSGTGTDDVYVEQASVGGAVATETLNLYKTAGETTDVQMVLRKGDKVTVTERRLVGNAVWGRMVSAKDTEKRQLWANLAGVTMDGQASAAPTTPTVTPSVTTPATVTIGVVVGNFDKVNVRQEPHVSSALVATVKKGDQVRVSEQKMSDGANWGKIDQGWIAMQYVSLKSETVATNVTTNVATGTTIMTSVPSGAIAAGFTSIDNLAVRSSAGVAMPQVGTLAKGSNVVISEITAANGLYWGKTDAGWICMSYVVNTAVGTAGSGTAGTIARCNYTVNVRATAGTNSAITGKIMVGSPVQIFETTTYSGELWGRTNLGWVAMQYVA